MVEVRLPTASRKPLLPEVAVVSRSTDGRLPGFSGRGLVSGRQARGGSACSGGGGHCRPVAGRRSYLRRGPYLDRGGWRHGHRASPLRAAFSTTSTSTAPETVTRITLCLSLVSYAV